MTGSDKTYDSGVFGPGAPGATRNVARQPLLDKPVAAELGGVNPLIVVPGTWTDRQVYRQALQLAGFLYSNASFSCLTPRVLIQPQGWSQRHQFLDTVGAILRQAGTWPACYPGAEARYQSFVSAHPEAQRFGEPSPGCLPWGAYPGHTPYDIQSGVGKVNNFYHLRQPQKAIFQAPFDGLQAGGFTSRRNAQFGRELAVALRGRPPSVLPG